MYRLCLLLLAVWQANAAGKPTTIQCSDVGITNCGTCNLPGVDCYACGPSTVMNADYSGCTSCPINCAICSWGKSATVPVCNICRPGYILAKDGSCAYCGDYCTSCTWSTGKVPAPLCQACQNIDGITLGSISQACLICPSKCKTCFESSAGQTTCTQCLAGYFQTSTGCSSCPGFCSQCTANAKTPSKGDCQACVTGYTLNTKDVTQSCLRWPAACKSVSGIESATNAGDSKCTACNDGYYFNNVDSCFPCIGGCTKCTSASVCTACETGFTLVGTQCKACTIGCDNCDGSTTTCNTCSDYWGAQASNLRSCTECPDYCESCATPGICDSCISTYFIASDGSCAKCGANCVECTDATTCSICVANYVVADDGKCYACDKNCQSNGCQKTAAGSKCTACNSKFYVSGQVCSACGSGCLVCTDSSTCTTCIDGYYLNNDGTCSACVVANSVLCNGYWNATKCASNYYVDATQQCTQCEANCDTCSSPTTCTKCMTGYALHSGDCVACDANCQTPLSTYCNTSSACSSCVNGYVSDSYACVKCPDHCLSSSCSWSKSSSSAVCSSCESGYYVNAGACSPCKAVCTKCTSNGACSACIANYILGGTTCYACPANCISGCTYSTQFTGYNSICSTSCANGYITSSLDGQCHQCPPQCTSCHWADASTEAAMICDTCEEDYGIQNGACNLCPFFCATCSVKTTGGPLVCDSCDIGYAMNTGPCGLCTDHCNSCTNVDGNMVCNQCDEYYTIASDGTCTPCPTSCSKCTLVGSKTVCSAGSCDIGTGRTFDGAACQSCGTLAFTGCSVCSDQAAQGVPSACMDCSAGYILNFWASQCLSTSALQNCWIPGARPFECGKTACQSPFNWITTGPAKGFCGISCSVCGDIDSNDFRPEAECQAAEGNYTQEMIPGGCWVARKVVNGVAMYARGFTAQLNCTADYSNEYVDAEGTSFVCCSSGDDCNADLILDGVAGASSIVASIALMLASIFVALRFL